jgi:hypothetical protein
VPSVSCHLRHYAADASACFAAILQKLWKQPPTELGDWLAYERAEPEWTLDEWLSSPPQNHSDLCRTNDSTSAPFVGEFAARSEQSIANAMTPSGRMRELAASVPRTSSAPWPRSP